MPQEYFKVEALAPGQHYYRDAVTGDTVALPVTKESLERKAELFREMRQNRILIPQFWGHQFGRGGPVHAQNRDERATDRARWLAGYMEDVEVDSDGRTWVVGEVPPGCQYDKDSKALIDPVNHTKIKQVSLGLGDWTDGTGRRWEDAIVHVALTPLPVYTGQDGFAAVDSRANYSVAFGDGAHVELKYVLGGGDMPGLLDPKAKKKAITPPDENEDTPPPEEGAAPEETEAETPPEETAGEPPADAPQAQVEPDADDDTSDNPMDQGIEGDLENGGEEEEQPDEIMGPLTEMLNELGIPLPEGVAQEHLGAVLLGIVTGLVSAKAHITVGGEHDLEAVGGLAKAIPGQAPLFMLATGEPEGRDLSPLEKALANRAAQDARGLRKARLEQLEQSGIPARVLDEVRDLSGRVHLSLDGEEVQATMPDLDRDISLLEKVAEFVGPLLLRVSLATGEATTAKANPLATAGRKPSDTPVDEEAHKQFLRECNDKTYGKGRWTDPRLES